MVGGQGPNDLQRAAQERRKQRQEARGLAQIVTTTEALKLQLEGENNPEFFIPGEQSRHRPPKNKDHGVEASPVMDSTKGRGKGRGRGRGRSKLSKLPSVPDLAKRILQAEEILSQPTPNTRAQANARTSSAATEEEEVSQNDQQVEETSNSDQNEESTPPAPQQQSTPRAQQQQQQQRREELESYTPRVLTRGNNPPFVTLFNDRSRYKCLGCNKWINKKDLPHPRDLLFTLKAIRPFLNHRTQQWVHPEKNGYFHLNIKCLQKHDPAIEIRKCTVTDETFMKLSQQQLEFLAGEGILEHVVTNKEKTL